MKIMLDCSPAKIEEYRERYAFDFWQLRTPLTGYARAEGVPWAFDNGCFKKFLRDRWLRMLDQARKNPDDMPIFVTVPDMVGDAQRTAELFEQFLEQTEGFKRALVLQDGIERVQIPWEQVDTVFIGGSDAFKVSPAAFAAARTAKMLGKQVHLGRVNTAARMRNWLGLADTGDGTGMCRFDHMLEDVMAVIKGEHPQLAMEAG
jgi:hypothetical protein